MPAVNTKASRPPRAAASGVQPNAVNEMVDGEPRAGVGMRLQLAHVVADAGQAFEPAIMVEQILDCLRGHVFFIE